MAGERHYFKGLLENGLAENIKARLGERFGNIKGPGLIALLKTKRRKRSSVKYLSVGIEAFAFGAQEVKK